MDVKGNVHQHKIFFINLVALSPQGMANNCQNVKAKKFLLINILHYQAFLFDVGNHMGTRWHTCKPN